VVEGSSSHQWKVDSVNICKIPIQGSLHLDPCCGVSATFNECKQGIVSPTEPERFSQLDSAFAKHRIEVALREKQEENRSIEYERSRAEYEQRRQEYKAAQEELQSEYDKKELQKKMDHEERRIARMKHPYRRLESLVAQHDESIMEALRLQEIETHLLDEDFPLAFGKEKAEFDGLKPWTKKSLREKAKLF